MTNLIKDVATLSTIPRGTLERLIKKAEGCICYTIEENLLNNEYITSLDCGIGSLNIKVEDDEIKYKFVPSPEFEQAIKKTVQTGKSPLETDVEESLKNKVLNVYKDLY